MSANAFSGRNPATFVGREAELEFLRQAHHRTASGEGRAVMLAGEAGIGKTRLVQEFVGWTQSLGGTAVWGHCYEGDGAPPYWPWIQVADQLRNLFPSEVQQLSTGDRGHLSLLLPGLERETAPASPSPQLATFGLLEAYCGFVRRCALQRPGVPLVIVLEDLHWADESSMRMLLRAARQAATTSVLLLGTYRADDSIRHSALGTMLAELRRNDSFTRLGLGGLSAEEVRSLLASGFDHAPSEELVRQLMERTEGNPMYVAELMSLLSRQDALVARAVPSSRLPDGILATMEHRLAVLSVAAREVLRTAAVLGREFDCLELSVVRGQPSETILAAVSEGEAAGLIEGTLTPGMFRFSHALLREAVLTDLPVAAQIQLQADVGHALERLWGEDCEAHSVRLANHFHYASALGSDKRARARAYALSAARQAERQFAWSEAWRWYEAAIDEDSPDPALLASLAQCCVMAVGTSDERGSAALQRAVDAFRAAGDTNGFVRAVARCPNLANNWAEQLDLALEAIALAGEAGPEINILLQMKLFWAKYWRSEPREVLAEVIAAVSDLAEQPGVREGKAWAHTARLFSLDPVSTDPEVIVNEGLLAAEEFARQGNIDEAGFYLSAGALGAAVLRGLLRRAESIEASAREFHDRYDHATGRSFVGMFGAARAHLRWELSRIEAAAAAGFGPTYVDARDRLADVRGERPYPPPKFERTTLPHDVMLTRARRAHGFLRGGNAKGANEEFRLWAELWLGGAAKPNIQARVTGFAIITPALLAFGDDEVCREVYEESRPWKNWCGPWCGIGIDACRGQLALRLGLLDDARLAFADGLEWSRREGCPVEEALNLEGLGDVMSHSGDAGSAIELYRAAAAILTDCGAKLYLQRVHQKLLEVTPAVAVNGRNAALSPRELDVLRLVATGSSNAEIARQLVLSTATVATHVRHILEKTGTANRAAAAAWAAQHGLA